MFTTLRAIVAISHAGSTVIFDYLDTGALVTGKAAQRQRYMREATRRICAPLLTGLASSTLAPDLGRLGPRLQEDLSPSDIEGRYFQDRVDHYHANKNAHFAWAVVE